MKAMILAAGRGTRMRELTASVPKPLLKINGISLLDRTINRLVEAGIKEIVINHAYLGQKIEEETGDGSRFGVQIKYSAEPEGLETGGGIFNAFPLLSDPFLVVNGDVYSDYQFSNLLSEKSNLSADAHLVLVDNPDFHPEGDFDFNGEKLTFSGIGIYRKQLFINCKQGKFPLAPLLYSAIDRNRITFEHYKGIWSDVGTPERLQKLSSY